MKAFVPGRTIVVFSLVRGKLFLATIGWFRRRFGRSLIAAKISLTSISLFDLTTISEATLFRYRDFLLAATDPFWGFMHILIEV
jgi:hypothetical protein